MPAASRRIQILVTLIVCSLPGSCMLAQVSDGQASAAPQTLRVLVDEVSLTFHVADANGLAVGNLAIEDVHLLDNGKPPVRILSFQSLEDAPVHAGILMDMSESMDPVRSLDRGIARQYTRTLLRKRTDQAFVINFDRHPNVTQPWTSSIADLGDAIRDLSALPGRGHRVHGTAIYDAIYRACHDQFGDPIQRDSRNFILLFTDGEDNASRYSLEDAAAMCQHTSTAIYAFRPRRASLSDGTKTLAQLASQTGGRVFHDDDPAVAIDQDLHVIQDDLRNEYRLIYKPAGLKMDGTFHRVELAIPKGIYSIVAPSGYYAISH